MSFPYWTQQITQVLSFVTRPAKATVWAQIIPSWISLVEKAVSTSRRLSIKFYISGINFVQFVIQMDYKLSQSKVEKSRQFSWAYNYMVDFHRPSHINFMVVTHTQVPILKILINASKVNRTCTQANTKATFSNNKLVSQYHSTYAEICMLLCSNDLKYRLFKNLR